MIGLDLFGAEGGYDNDRCPVFARLALPAFEQPDGEAVGPLAVVEEHKRGPALCAQRVEQGGKSLEAAPLAAGLRADIALAGPPEELRELRQGGRDCLSVVVEAFAYSGRHHRVGLSREQEVAGDTLEEVERALGGLVDALPAHDPRPPPG